MSAIFLFAIIVLVLLAVIDLWVGVANDAVNFMNSAIGAAVARRRTILIVASVGVFVGALFSSGMMEVARKGIFDPSFFYNADGVLDLNMLLVLYLGVMVADVIMLDVFNTLGLPTSTTVSIVSDLLGAAIAVTLWKNGGDISSAFSAINHGPVLGIYTGIFSSILIAFVAAAIGMVLMRFLFTRDLARTFKYFGWAWTGLSISSLTYFVVFKGIATVPFLPEGAMAFMKSNIWPIMAVVFAVSAISAHLLRNRYESIFRFLILAGTLGLAMSFAANDLVNFMGPTVAAAQAVFVDNIKLSGNVPTPGWALAAAGLVMVFSLWFAKKSHTVTDTEIRLAAEGEVEQRWNSHALSRAVVRGVGFGFNVTRYLIPPSLRQSGQRRFSFADNNAQRPPYDLLRASLNLTLASLLISAGTAHKLPLSTTYITFMVAMGSSFADGAWEASSVEKRVAGMLNVIGGWVVTGVLAASGAFLFTSLLYWLGLLPGIIISIFLVGLSFKRTGDFHRRKFSGRKTVYDRHFHDKSMPGLRAEA